MFPYFKKLKPYILVFYFMIYSFIGWIFEISVIFLDQGRYESRGFIFGPFCIIYGFGIILLLMLLAPLKDRIFLYFLASSILISALEFMTGTLLELIFHRRWWDYSHLPFNLNGHISLGVTLLWGLLAVISANLIQPKLDLLINRIPESKAVRMSYFIALYFIMNIAFSIVTTSGMPLMQYIFP